ncbi:copper transporter [Schnuerera ultunensis]|uniref:copper transporter n=1 Tax=Schnuerera ultunensis TaxID=45497 RepID=UPI0003F6A2CC|nr:copper transporter [Schnuerera ultunensis]
MIPNMKFYVISIVAIFAALGIGIYIGFTLDAQSFIVEQKEDIAAKIEERFDFLTKENQQLKSSIKNIEAENDRYKYFIDSTYEEIVRKRLEGINVAIIETKSDYMYSGVGQILETAGANVINVTTISDRITNEELLKEIYDDSNLAKWDINLITNSIIELTRSIVNGEETELVTKLMEKNCIDVVGLFNEPVDYIILAGGSLKEEKNRLNLIDKAIINTAKNMEKSIIGVEKENTNISYMEDYKKFRISTVDNVNTNIGKVSLILAMEGRPGHYGIKPTAEELTPRSSLPALEYSKGR